MIKPYRDRPRRAPAREPEEDFYEFLSAMVFVALFVIGAGVFILFMRGSFDPAITGCPHRHETCFGRSGCLFDPNVELKDTR